MDKFRKLVFKKYFVDILSSYWVILSEFIILKVYQIIVWISYKQIKGYG